MMCFFFLFFKHGYLVGGRATEWAHDHSASPLKFLIFEQGGQYFDFVLQPTDYVAYPAWLQAFLIVNI